MLHILHLHSSFQQGGKELRCAKLINAFGKVVRHSIVSAIPEALDAAQAIDTVIDVDFPKDFPPLVGRPMPRRLQKLANAMKPYDLVLTYNWGAMDAVMAHTIFRDHLSLPPLVHHEDGFNEDEAGGLKWNRNWYRRLALAKSAALVVPSKRLEKIAFEAWQRPAEQVCFIPNGINVAAYGGKTPPDALPRIVKRPGERWLGTLAGLRRVKNLPKLVRTFSSLPEEWHLVILGEGDERETIMNEAMRLKIAHRVHLPGFAGEPAKVIGLFDLFALSSDSEQFPISVVEAMAAGLAVVAPDVGDVAGMVSPENRDFIVPHGDEPALGKAVAALAGDEALRSEIGRANQILAAKDFDEARMIDAYRALYARALGRNGFP